MDWQVVRLFGQIALSCALTLVLVVPVQAQPAKQPVDVLITLVPDPLANVVPRLQKLCDFAVIAAQLQSLPVADDPVFRQPTAQKKAELGKIRKEILEGGGVGLTLAQLLAGPEGPTLARLALQDKDPRVALVAVQAAVPLARQHPRLFAFLPTLDAKTPSALALAMIDFDFATGCDTPALFALDALAHPDSKVVAAVLDRTLALASHTRQSAALNRVVDWLRNGKGPPALRVHAARQLGNAGYLALLPLWTALAADRDAQVALEAIVAQARLLAIAVAPKVLTLLGDSRPAHQIAGLRAAVFSLALDRLSALTVLKFLEKSKNVWRDPASGQTVQVAVVAARVLARLELRSTNGVLTD